MPVGELSQGRVAPSVVAIVAEFGGEGVPLPVQLRNGRDQALVAIRRFRPEFNYDAAEASGAGREIDAWAERNHEALDQILASSADELPEQLQLAMGSDRAQSFVLATFTAAAAGLGPWFSGEVARLAAAGGRIDERWAREDASDRLQAFALIVKLEREGALEKIFVGPADGAGALGFVVPVWLVVVILVVLAAALVVLVLGWRRIDLNNRLMKELCDKAYKDGRHDVVKACVEAAKDLQITPIERTTQKLITQVGVGLAAAAVVYVGLTFGVPALLASRARSRGREASA